MTRSMVLLLQTLQSLLGRGLTLWLLLTSTGGDSLVNPHDIAGERDGRATAALASDPSEH
jgi:hypothetical protein